MRYQVTVTETTSKYAIVEADSIEEAKAVGYDAARLKPEPDYIGPTRLGCFRVGDDAELGGCGSPISQ